MPLDNHFSGSPADWLRHARSDLELAGINRPDEVFLFEELRFHAQQAAEKALKAVLIAKGISPPKTHNIRMLLDILSQVIVAPRK
jgi:HEPN domain-containing protein